MAPGRKLRVGIVGGFGVMASPMSRHWQDVEPVTVLRVHDRRSPGVNKDRIRQAWQEQGAILVHSLEELVGEGDLDGVVVCCGKNGDDLPIVAVLADLLSKHGAKQAFICHMSTVSTAFVKAAHEFCLDKNVRYMNCPLTGGALGAETATMLLLASGDLLLYEELVGALALLGTPRYFGASITAAAEVKFMGQLMVFNGLTGICSAAAVHAECLNDGKLGGAKQADFFDFLNAGAGGTRQWDVALGSGLKKQVWDAPFLMKYAVVDAIYAAQICLDKGLSRLAIEPIINIALAFSYVINEVGQGLATQAVVKELLSERASSLDLFLEKHADACRDKKAALLKCIESLPEAVKNTVVLELTATDFAAAINQTAAKS